METQPEQTEEARIERVAREIFERLAAELTAKLEERERVGAMTEAERGDYELSRREAELQAREQALRARELKAMTAQSLAARGLPAELAEVLELRDEAGCAAAVEALDAAFRAAVKRAVEEKLSGGSLAPDGDSMSDEEYYRTLR